MPPGFPTTSRLIRKVTVTTLAVSLLIPGVAAAQNPVLEWDRITHDAVLAAGTNPVATTRVFALVLGSVYDAVNGVEHRYEPLRVRSEAPKQASSRAAAIQAAYAMLTKLYPAQAATFTARRDASLAAITTGPGSENARAIAAGLAWGQAVADELFAWRDTDGFNPPSPPFLGANAIGVWRPTAPGTSGLGPNFATMTPWVMMRASQFRIAAPPALTSAQYAADYNEIKAWGSATGSPRSADDTDLALFWAGNSGLFWNRIALQVVATRSLSLVDTARVFALMNVAVADAAIACWDAKFRFVFWRPITAIANGDDDGNPATAGDPTWRPLLAATPPHPENPSGHSTMSAAAAVVLESFFGDANAFTLDSEVHPSVRSFSSFSAAVEEVKLARVYAGIHFRTACDRGAVLGRTVGSYVIANAMLDDHGGSDQGRRR